MTDARDTYYLVDGSGFIFRAFHALPMMTRRSDGTPVNAVYGFTNMILKLLADVRATHIAVVFDAARENFRNTIYADYKANRDDPPPELVPQFALIYEATEAFGLPFLRMEGYEADDIIATFARQAREAGQNAVIVSSDKDLMQLVGDGVTMFDPMKNRPIGEAEVVEKFGVPPEKVVDVQALAGDSIDNVPGVPGIGVKTAAQLIAEYGDLESLLSRAGEIKQPKRRQNLQENAELARISKQLVRLDDHVPVTMALSDLNVDLTDRSRLLTFLEAQNFRSIVAKVQAELRDAAGAGAGAEGETPATAPEPEAVEKAYELVQDEAALQVWIDRATEAGIVAVDTETTSLDAARADLVGLSLSTTAGQACYIPLGHIATTLEEAGNQRQIPLPRAMALLKPMLEDPSVLKVGQNVKYDWHILARHDARMAPVDDTMLLSYVLDGARHGHGMDELSQLWLDHKPIAYSEICGTGKNQITFDQVPLDRARDYAAEDADITLRLHQILKPRLVPERMVTLYETMERPLAPVIAEMEMHGIKVDRDVLQRLSTEFAGRLVELEGAVHQLAGHAFNVGSPKQLGTVLFDEMGLAARRKGKSGTYSTDSAVLEEFAAQGHDIAARVLDWRQLSKLKGTYTDALIEQINPRTGRVHTSFSLAATNTGRLSSNDPNLQNIPIRTEEGRKIRYAFVAEPGNALISIDYSQIELRLVAQIASVRALQQAFRDGQDIHAMTASQVFGVPLDELTAETRRRAKAINFGIIYGISAFGLGNQLGIPQGEARTFIQAYLDRFAELRDWMEATRTTCRDQGYVETLFGRRVHIPTIKDPNPARRGFAERQAINAPIQGTAADIIKRAMVRIPPALSRAGLSARMLLQVHDELLFEAPKGEAEETAALVKRIMEDAAHLEVPLVADVGIGPSWAEAH